MIFLLLLAQPATGQLADVESSAGLDEPGLESGRTELAFGDVDGDDAAAGVYLARLITATGVLARTSVALVR